MHFFAKIRDAAARKNRWSITNTTAIFVLLVNFFEVLTFSARVINIISPTDALVMVAGDKQAKLYYTQRVGQALMGASIAATVMNLSVVWMKVATSVKTLKILTKQFERYEKFIYSIQVICFILYLVAILMANLSIITTLATVLVVLLFILCVYTSRRLSMEINQRVETMVSHNSVGTRPLSTRVWTEQYKETNSTISCAAIGIAIGLVFFFLGAMLTTLIEDKGFEYRQLKFTSLVVISLNVAEIGGFIIVGSIIRYLRRLILKVPGGSKAVISSVSGAAASPNLSKISKDGIGSKEGSKVVIVLPISSDIEAHDVVN